MKKEFLLVRAEWDIKYPYIKMVENIYATVNPTTFNLHPTHKCVLIDMEVHYDENIPRI